MKANATGYIPTRTWQAGLMDFVNPFMVAEPD